MLGRQGSLPAINGQIREVRISTIARYDKDFTPTERFESDEQTLVLYHLDEATDDILVDSSDNDHDGKIDGATWAPGQEQPIGASE